MRFQRTAMQSSWIKTVRRPRITVPVIPRAWMHGALHAITPMMQGSQTGSTLRARLTAKNVTKLTIYLPIPEICIQILRLFPIYTGVLSAYHANLWAGRRPTQHYISRYARNRILMSGCGSERFSFDNLICKNSLQYFSQIANEYPCPE